jgi:hypothetical protein
MPALGHRLESATVTLDNPAFSPSHPETPGNPRRIVVSINMRGNVIGLLASRGALSVSQGQAAERFRALYETVHLGGIYTPRVEPRVDSSGLASVLPAERLVGAVRELREAQALIGQRGFALLVAIVGQDRSLHELGTTRRERDTLVDLLRMALDDLAQRWGYLRRKGR